MTGVSGSELLVVLALAYLLFGPREAARTLRALGEVTARGRRFLRQMQQEFDAALREGDGGAPGRPRPTGSRRPAAPATTALPSAGQPRGGT